MSNNRKWISWDKSCIHGDYYKYEYIRWKENARVLKKIQSTLKEAYTARRKRELKAKQRTILSLLSKLLYTLRAQLNRKNGVQL